MSPENKALVRRMAAQHDVVICSWEPFDALARFLSPPCIMILHNVTSRSLPALFPGNPLAAFGARQARIWERRSYSTSGFAAVGTLSRRDYASVAALSDSTKLLLLPPGMPPSTELDRNAPLVEEIVISGTFDWVPKRRDLLAFAREYAACHDQVPIRAAQLPVEAMRNLQPAPPPSADEAGSAIRFGLITDRFEAGHKLKTLAYIAANQIVLTFADVRDDLAHIPDHVFFIRKIATAEDIGAVVREFSALPPAVLRDRFLTFKRRCEQSFTWTAVASTLLDTAEEMRSVERETVAAV